MTSRDELAALLRDAALTEIAGLPVLTFEGYADAIIAAGWRPPPPVLTDPAELADVPAGSVVQVAALWIFWQSQLTRHEGNQVTGATSVKSLDPALGGVSPSRGRRPRRQ